MRPDRSPQSAVDEGALRLAHERFVSSHRASPGVRALVAQSWARSDSGGVIADGSRLPDIRLDTDELDGYRAEHPLASLLPVFRDLLGPAALGEECIFAVADADGTLLWVEGDRRVLAAAERMHFVEGAGWAESIAGTNAPGTALVLQRPVQISGPEHFNAAVHPWTCCAVPIRGPGGRVIGVLDLTGGDRLAHPQALSLVRATARMAETELARRGAAVDGQALREYLDRLDTPANRPAALLTGDGRVLHAGAGIDPADLSQLPPTMTGPLILPDGRLVTIDSIGAAGHRLVRVDGPAYSSNSGKPLRLSALGRDWAVLDVDGQTHRLSRKHSEVVVALSLMMGGTSADRLAVMLSDAQIPAVTLRVEMSRLRGLLGADVLGSRPYELRRQVRSDYTDVRDLLAAGRLSEAMAAYTGPLLPWSDAPVIVEARQVLEQQLRGAVLGGRNPGLLRRWVDAPWGVDDGPAWRALADSLPGGSAQRAAAAGRAQALRYAAAVEVPGRGLLRAA
jgi:hypothetical protein